MVERREILRIALRAWCDCGTAMAAAMLRAYGMCPALIPRGGARGGSGTEDYRYRSVRWCFENHGSPMDGMR